MRRVTIKSKSIPNKPRSGNYPSGSTVVYSGGGSGGSGASAELYFRKQTDPNGTAYIITDYPVVTSHSMAFGAGPAPYIPSMFDELPIDEQTIKRDAQGRLYVANSGSGGLASVTVKLGNTPYTSVDGVVSLPAYPDTGNFVTLNTEQRIRANKWFGDNFKIDSDSGKPVIVAYSGPWERGLEAQASTGDVLGKFGFFGDGDTLHYAYIGNNYGNPWLHITPTGRLSTMLNGENTALRLLKDSNSPYGLITSLKDTGEVILQAQRDANPSETFLLQLNPNGGSVSVGRTDTGDKQLTVGSNMEIQRTDGADPFLLFHYPNHFYSRLACYSEGLQVRSGDNNTNAISLRVSNGGRIGIGLGWEEPSQSLDVNGYIRTRAPLNRNPTHRFAAIDNDGVIHPTSNGALPTQVFSVVDPYRADLSGLNENLWYPVAVPLNIDRVTRIRICNILNTNVPSWSTHPAGFTVVADMECQGTGWGTTPSYNRLNEHVSSFYSGFRPFGTIGIIGEYSKCVLYLRGGGIYNLWTDGDINGIENPRGSISWGIPPYVRTVEPLPESAMPASLETVFHTSITANITGYELNIRGNALISGYTTWGSDARYKTILGKVKLSLEQIASAPTVYYKWNEKKQYSDGLTHVGGIAQYVESILPELTAENDNFKSLDYSVCGYVFSVQTARHLRNHIQRYAHKEDARDKEIRALRKKVEQSEKRIEDLEKQLMS